MSQQNQDVFEFSENARLLYCGYQYLQSTLELEYTERSSDSWYSDIETSVSIDLEELDRLIDWLTRARARLTAVTPTTNVDTSNH
jgi:hypothetical protein